MIESRMDYKIECTALKLKCRGIDSDGKPVLDKDSAESVIVRVQPEVAGGNFNFRNVVYCRYLGRFEKIAYRGRFKEKDGWEDGFECTVSKPTRKLESFAAQDETRRCPYLG